MFALVLSGVRYKVVSAFRMLTYGSNRSTGTPSDGGREQLLIALVAGARAREQVFAIDLFAYRSAAMWEQARLRLICWSAF